MWPSDVNTVGQSSFLPPAQTSGLQLLRDGPEVKPDPGRPDRKGNQPGTQSQGPGGGLPISRGLGQATGGCEESVEKSVSLNSDMSMSVSSSGSSSIGTGVFHPSRCLCQ